MTEPGYITDGRDGYLQEEFPLPAEFYRPEPGAASPKKRRFKAKPGKRAKQRSMELLRKEGFTVGNAEYWSAFAKRTIDLFNFIDLVCLSPENKTVAVQVTKGFLNEHIEKIQSLPAAQHWLKCGNLIHIHWWRELGPKGAKTWVLEVIEVTA